MVKKKFGGARSGAGRPPSDPKARQAWEEARAARLAAKAKAPKRRKRKAPKAVKALQQRASKQKAVLEVLDTVGKHLSAEQIRAIIALCQAKNVRRLKTADFEIELGPEGTREPKDSSLAPSLADQAPTGAAKLVDPLDPEAMRDMAAAQLMIDDPLAFEQAQIDEMTTSANAEADSRQAQPDLRGG